MKTFQRLSLFLLRIGLGLVFFWAGFEKLTDPTWSAAGYLQGAKTFHSFFAWFASPAVLPVTNFLNEWGLTLIGIALILGVAVRLASYFGIVMLLLYYFPVYPPANGVIDDHIMYALIFIALIAFGSGNVLSLSRWLQTHLHPAWHKWID